MICCPAISVRTDRIFFPAEGALDDTSDNIFPLLSIEAGDTDSNNIEFQGKAKG